MPQQAEDGPRRPGRPRAEALTLIAIFRTARKIKHAARRGTTPESPQGQELVRQLLEAAADWRKSAVERSTEAGLRPMERPSFRNMPKTPTPQSLPSAGQYTRNLTWWASRYAWDIAEGKPAEEASKGLIMTAVMGPRPKKKATSGQEESC